MRERAVRVAVLLVSNRRYGISAGDLPLEIAAGREGCLIWEKGATILFVGTVSSDVRLVMTVCSYRQQISHV